MALEPLSPRTTRVLPNYAHPPLIAVRMGIRCATAAIVDVDALAKQLGPSWLKSERSASPQRWARIGPTNDELISTFAGVLGDQHLEVYANGIDFLWDGRSGESYPHYETLRDAFLTAFDGWSQTPRHAVVSPVRWHVSYWNRIPQGTVWQQLADLRFCRLLASAHETPFAEQLAGFQQNWMFRAAGSRTQLRCDAWLENGEPATNEDVIWIALTSSGETNPSPATSSESGNDWLSELDAGRRSIVSGFRGLMSPSANAYWGLID